MIQRVEIPFDSIENAQQYIRLLAETVAETRRDIENEITLAIGQMSDRRVQALRMVEYNLEKLQRHLSISGRTLNDLRSLRRLLHEARPATNDTKRQNLAGTLPLTSTISASEPLRVGKIRAVATS